VRTALRRSAPAAAATARRGAPRLPLASVQRGLCAVAESEAPLSEIVETQIAEAEAMLAAVKSKEGMPYTEAELAKDVEAGTIDLDKITAMMSVRTMGDLDGEMPAWGSLFASKMKPVKDATILACTEINEMSASTPEVAKIDWAEMEKEYVEAGIDTTALLAFKAGMEETLATLEAGVSEAIGAEVATLDKIMAMYFEGPGGMKALAKEFDEILIKEKTYALERLTEMKDEILNIRTVTVAEILEKNPEWAKEIEEDIKNHNWAPDKIGPTSSSETAVATEADTEAAVVDSSKEFFAKSKDEIIALTKKVEALIEKVEGSAEWKELVVPKMDKSPTIPYKPSMM